jgi:hypothetical protein
LELLEGKSGQAQVNSIFKNWQKKAKERENKKKTMKIIRKSEIIGKMDFQQFFSLGKFHKIKI